MIKIIHLYQNEFYNKLFVIDQEALESLTENQET